MKHKLFNLKAWLVMLVMAFVSTGAWAETYTYDFSGVKKGSETLWFSDAKLETSAGCYTSSNKGTTATKYYYKNGDEFTFYASTNYYFSVEKATDASYFMLGKTGAYVILPTYENEKITSIAIQGSTGHSTNVSVNIYNGETPVSTPQTWSEKGKLHEYAIISDYQRKQLRVQVTNGYNTQFTSIVITTQSTAGEVAKAEIPTLTESTSFLDSQEVTITNNESGATVYYTTDGNDPTTSSTSFTGASKTFTVTSTTTVKAMAVATGKDNSSVASSTYTKMVKYDNVAAFVAAKPSIPAALQLTSAVVIGNSNNKSIYVKDETGTIVLYNGSGTLPAGAVYGKNITGIVSGTHTIYQYYNEVVGAEFIGSVTYSDATVPFEGTSVSIADVSDEMIGSQISLNGVKFQSTALDSYNRVELKDSEGNSIKLFDFFKVLSSPTFSMSSSATVSGILFKSGTGETAFYQIVPESSEGYISYEAEKLKPTNSWSAASIKVTMGEDNEFPTFETNSDGAVTYTSSKETVATISDTGVVTLVSPGTTTITATTAETEKYLSGKTSYELTVVKAASVLEEGVYFYEDFSTVTQGDNTTATGSSNGWNGNEDNNIKVGNNYVYQAGGCVRLGTKSEGASVTFGPLDLSQNGGIFHISFDVKGWTEYENAVLKISVTGQEDVTRPYSATMTDEFENIDLVYSGGIANSYITITASKRTFIDNIKVYYSEVKNKPECNWSKEVAYGILLDPEVYPTYNFVSPTFTSESEGEVTYSSSNSDVASIDAEGVITLKATGETTISATTAATTIYSEASASYQLYVVSLEGDGSFDKPFTPSDIVYLSNNLNDKYWVTGTIAEKTAAEQDSENNGMIADASKNVNTNVVLVDTKNNIPVGLASGSVRNFVNVKDNAGNVNKTVKIYGSLGAAYFNRPGVKDCSKVVIPEIQPSVTIDENGWGAHYNKYSYEIPEGLTAYTVDVDPITQTVTFSKLTSGTIVAAYTPLLFNGEAGTSQYVIVNTNASAKQQKLRGQLEAGVLTTEKDSEGSEIACKYYKFDSASETFVYGAEEGGVFEVAANGVYLAVPTTISTGSVLSLVPTIVTVTRLINDALNTTGSKVTTNTISNQAEKVLKNQSVLEK